MGVPELMERACYLAVPVPLTLSFGLSDHQAELQLLQPIPRQQLGL